MYRPEVNLVERLQNRIKEKPARSIIVVGDTMLDVWVHGSLEYTSQEGCPKFVQELTVETPGGAENAEHCISEWKVPTLIYGQNDLDCAVKTRFVVGRSILFRVDQDKRSTDTGQWNLKRELSVSAASRAGAVLISDYDKGFITKDLIRRISEQCSQRGVPCVADCKRAPEFYFGCILKGNVEWLYKHKPNLMTPLMVVTNGKDNPTVEGRMVPVNHSNVNCVNHVGSGDCFAAHLTLALAYGFSLKEAATLAHSAGRVYVQYEHNRPPMPEEIAEDLSNVR